MNLEVLSKQIGDQTGQVLALSGDVRKQTERLVEVENEIDKISDKMAAMAVNGRGPAQQAPGIAHKALGEFARSGTNGGFAEYVTSRPDVKAAMSVSSDPDGGYTVAPEIETTVKSLARDISPLFDLANVKETTRGSYKWVVDDSLLASGWVGESEARPETAGAKLRERTITCGEIYANPAATQTLLDDSSQNVAAWLTDKAGTSFATKQGAAFVSGDGIKNKPRGFLTYPTDPADDFTRAYGVIQYVAAGSATPSATQLSDALIALSMKLRVPYRTNAKWIMARDTARIVRQLRDSNQLLLWAGDGRLVDGVPGQLLGFDVALCEDMPAIGANAYPIAFGDWKQGYIVLDRVGIRVLADPYTNKPNVNFYCTKRISGDVDDFNAIKLLKIAAS